MARIRLTLLITLALGATGCCFGGIPGMSTPEPLAVCQHATAIHDAHFADDTPTELARVEGECVMQLTSTRTATPDQYAPIANCVMAVALPPPGDAAAATVAESTLALCNAPSHMVMVASCANTSGVCSEWSGAQWLALGADNTARAADAPSHTFPGCADTLRVGEPCSRAGAFGMCVAPDRVTYYSNIANASLVQSACSFMNGQWVPM